MPVADAAVIEFLRGDAGDGRGRTLAEVLGRDDAWLESVHDYIQWLFPLRQASRAVPDAPVLSSTGAETVRQDQRARGCTRHWSA